ncbi:SDR family NAD(P)-dependent oxidoreductase [Streptomyces sp. NPDC050617]|uniref:SDR family NAD(P)-dependent oxidoreductase n=1 Tax=Streptomyces sp. NPDC050617 TaxID=3154628 RepID=UPI003435449D
MAERAGRPSPRVLVTGGASGIGAAIVRRFVRDGARVAVLDRDRDALARIADDLPDAVLPLHADVAEEDRVREAFAEAGTVLGGLDVVCNNAGISIRRPFLETSLEEWERTMRVNLTGAFLVAREAGRRMAIGGGVIVNTASVSGMVGMPDYAAYNVSKAGVIELTRTLALELAPAVRVNAIAPGYVVTSMQRAEYTEEQLAEQAGSLPLRRLGAPEEIAGLAAYLASPDAAFITGQTFVIDGGETAGGLASAARRHDAREVHVDPTATPRRSGGA